MSQHSEMKNMKICFSAEEGQKAKARAKEREAQEKVREEKATHVVAKVAR